MLKDDEKLSSLNPPEHPNKGANTDKSKELAVSQMDPEGPSGGSDWETVTIGSDKEFFVETDSRSRTVRDYLGGSATADTNGTKCLIKTKSAFAGIPGAYAQTWVSFEVQSDGGSPSDKHCDISISTEYAASWLTVTIPYVKGSAGAGAWKVGVYVYDYEAGDWLERELVAEGKAALEDVRQKRGSDEVEMGVNLEAGKNTVSASMRVLTLRQSSRRMHLSISTPMVHTMDTQTGIRLNSAGVNQDLPSST
ncbi:hypothetical protein [Halosimplex halobium]|uniref:hypothetical protein n=1 Tax=Halosimplex halobium TaxID=3396618 RepID=UPI003F578DD2